ncbi:MarR family winged helix-turn-helix transcriptional regulator [Gordonia metallireducens]|uniref:MarR family winged helix-turn-helix transcriptional regulator n=1 Tax=Gordonia metallireducens TaxID=2897779 RepID=UPI001E2E1D50|nr:MarR family transcriptional regulator [Gordonia metallireducens]
MDVSRGAQFARLLLETFDAMTREVVEELADAGHPGLTVTNELAMEAIDDGAGNAASLARRLGVSRQAAAKTITALEGLGYVERAADADDARRKSLRITARGREAIRVGSAAFDRIRVRWEAALGADRVAETEDALRFLRDGVPEEK